MKRGKRMTDEERTKLCDAFVSGGFEAACAALPGRRPYSLRMILERLGHPTTFVSRGWTLRQQDELRRFWPSETIPTLALRFGRSRSAIWQKASKLKLPRKAARAWTPGQQKIVEREVDALIERLAERICRTPRAVRNKAIAALYNAGKRDRRNRIVDLGGMGPSAIGRRDVA